MEGSFIYNDPHMIRINADRYLQRYRKMSAMLRSSQAYKKSFGNDGMLDEATVQAEMFAIRALILSVEDTSEKYLLYHYYIKGCTVKKCARLLGVSLRTAHRIKARALEIVATLLSQQQKSI